MFVNLQSVAKRILTSFPLFPSLQTSSQTELENWITAIHSACATAVARQHHKEDTVKLLKTEIKKLEQKIDMDEKMKKMGEMQLSSVTDSKKKKTILDQVILLAYGKFPPQQMFRAFFRLAAQLSAHFLPHVCAGRAPLSRQDMCGQDGGASCPSHTVSPNNVC